MQIPWRYPRGSPESSRRHGKSGIFQKSRRSAGAVPQALQGRNDQKLYRNWAPTTSALADSNSPTSVLVKVPKGARLLETRLMVFSISASS